MKQQANETKKLQHKIATTHDAAISDGEINDGDVIVSDE